MSQLCKEDDVKSETSEISEVSFLEDSDVESDDLKSINSQDLDTPDVSDGEMEEPKCSPKMSGNSDSDSKILENSENVKSLPLYLPPQETSTETRQFKDSEDSGSSDSEFSVLGKSNGSIESIDSEEEPEEEEEHPKIQQKSEKNLGSLISAVENLNIELGKMKVKILESVNKRNAKKESVELKCQKLKDLMKIQNLELELKKATDQNKVLEKELQDAKSEIQNLKKSLENRKEKREPVILKQVVPIFGRGLLKTDVFGIEQQTIPSFDFKRSEKPLEDKKEKRQPVLLKPSILGRGLQTGVFGSEHAAVPTFDFIGSKNWLEKRRAERSKENSSRTVKEDSEEKNPEPDSEIVAERSLTQLQMEILEKEFQRAQWPDHFEREGIAQEIGVSEQRVENWFMIRRAKWNKENSSEPVELSEDDNQESDSETVTEQSFTQLQDELLEKEFEKTKYPGIFEREKIAGEIGVSLKSVTGCLSKQQRSQQPSGSQEVLEGSKDDKQAFKQLFAQQTAIFAKEVARSKYPDELGREHQITMGEIAEYLRTQQQAKQKSGRPSEPLDVVDSWDDL
ncbi:hypothetical protein B9Z55_015736 [Caenorhabditis nigoni]|uniref:Homeobox domain-containing protein n=1 Tax=Caenorhabditis nigoni TaxID=1611254 RepID=A0A2G5UBJ7_9PELO|nr:hypothetical protein B9Z55_015736 [Caenorhabditis nigoni]